MSRPVLPIGEYVIAFYDENDDHIHTVVAYHKNFLDCQRIGDQAIENNEADSYVISLIRHNSKYTSWTPKGR